MLTINSNILSVYCHIPFCRIVCSYCAFNTYADLSALVPAYVSALASEIAYVGRTRPGLQVGTIFFGGGTPSVLTPEQYAYLMATLRKAFILAPHAEMSMEINPLDLTASYARMLRDLGFTRLSIGMQSSDPATLKLFKRDHDYTSVQRSVEAGRSAGFDNIALDLIFGAPGQKLAEWDQSLSHALALHPAHLSLYGLELHGGTQLVRWIQQGSVETPDTDLVVEMYDLAREKLQSAGYEHYEISNWARPGYESQHNLQYWRNLPYLGLGAGAHGYADDTRTIVRRIPHRYIDAMNQSACSYRFPLTPATSKATPVSQEMAISETIMMGLRLTREGIQRTTFRARFGLDVVDWCQKGIQRHLDRGLLELNETTLRLTAQGQLLSNYVLADLI